MSPIAPIHARRWLTIVVSVLLGASLGLFAQGTWLAESAWKTAVTLLIVTLGAAVYFFHLRWMQEQWHRPADRLQSLLALVSLLAGLFLFSTLVGGTRPSGYVSFFLPRRELQIQIVPAREVLPQVSILRFETSLGDIPFSELDYRGWEARDGRLTLTSDANELRWAGRAGAEARITFESASQDGQAVVIWDGQKKAFPLVARKYVYAAAFDVPFFASARLLSLLGLLNALALSIPAGRLIWKTRDELTRFLLPLLSGSTARFDAADWAVLCGAIILALILRLPNLGMWSLIGVDEYSHLNAAKWMLANSSFDPEYRRSLWMVTWPISLAFQWIGREVWAARLVGALFNVGALILLYLAARRVGREVARLSVILFAASPWMIVFSRVIREYAYHPFYYFWIVYGLIVILEKIPAGFRLGRDGKALASPRNLLVAAALCLPPIYALIVDPQSTFKLVFLVYIAFGLVIVTRMDLRDRSNLALLLGAALTMFAALYIARDRAALLGLAFGFNPSPLDYFLPSAAQQWFYLRGEMWPALGLLAAILAGGLLWRERPVALFFVVLFGACLGFFVFSNNQFSSPRHLVLAQLWYVILTALGLRLVWAALTRIFPRRAFAALAALVLGLLSFNLRHMLSPSFSADSVALVTGDYFYDLRALQAHLAAHAGERDALISTAPYARHVAWMEAPQFSSVHLFPVYAAAEDILALVRQSPSGWIVMDRTRVDATAFSPFEAFEQAGLRYEGTFGDEYLWRWDAPLP
jgi:hypothetical protein